MGKLLFSRWYSEFVESERNDWGEKTKATDSLNILFPRLHFSFPSSRFSFHCQWHKSLNESKKRPKNNKSTKVENCKASEKWQPKDYDRSRRDAKFSMEKSQLKKRQKGRWEERCYWHLRDGFKNLKMSRMENLHFLSFLFWFFNIFFSFSFVRRRKVSKKLLSFLATEKKTLSKISINFLCFSLFFSMLKNKKKIKQWKSRASENFPFV